MAGVTTLDSRATGDGQEEEHTRKQGDNDNDDNVNDNDNDRLPATDTLPRTSNSVTPSHHKQIQPPRYVRSIPLGLQRANTLSSSSSGSPVKLKQQQHSSGNTATPTVSHSDIAVRPRRTSVPFPHSNEEQQHSKASNLPPRSESALGLSGTSTRSVVVPSASPTKLLPLSKSYNGPPDRKLQSLLFDYGDTSQVSELPSDPKTWTPSQLSIYLSHMLRLTPRPVIADVMKFVVQRGLTGKRFLRLRNQDLIEMGININWCRVLSTARERLRRECLRGRVFGFTVQNTDDKNDFVTCPAAQEEKEEEEEGNGEETIESLFLKLPSSTSTRSLNQEWNKNSWRRTEGKKSRGRVKGIAKVFEEGQQSSNNDTPADEFGRRRSLSIREAELDEISRIRRNRQESNDSTISSNSSNNSTNTIPYSPKITLSNTYLDLPRHLSEKSNYRQADAGTQASDSESEAEDRNFDSSSENKFNWSNIEPLAIEETASLSENFFAYSAAHSTEVLISKSSSSSSSSSSPSTPCASAFLSNTVRDFEAEERKDKGKNLSNDYEDEKKDSQFIEEGDIPTYQSRILSHGQDAYAALRVRKQSDLSEVTDELSEEHLSHWQNLRYSVQQSEQSKIKEGHGASSEEVNAATSHEPFDKIIPYEAESATMVFAESDGNIITMKKHSQSIGHSRMGSLSKRTRSVEDFGSLKFHTVRSRNSASGETRRMGLKDLFEEGTSGDGSKSEKLYNPWGTSSSAAKGKHSDRKGLSDLFRDEEQSDQFYSLKSRSGSIMILPRAEVEEMQARLRYLEQQLELAKSASASRASGHSKSSSVHSSSSTSNHFEVDHVREISKSQAMSEWVKGALGEANTIVNGGRQEPSWLGLGSWALAAGLGIGIVVGEAVFSKLRR